MSENTLLILVKMLMTTKMNGSWDCFPTNTYGTVSKRWKGLFTAVFQYVTGMLTGNINILVLHQCFVLHSHFQCNSAIIRSLKTPRNPSS